MKQKAKNIYNSSFFRYIVIGGSTFLIDFLLLIILHGGFNLNVLVAASISYWVSILYNFLLNRYWSFKIKGNTDLYKHIFLYAALLGFNYLFTITFLAITVNYYHLNYMISKLIAVGFQITWTYLIYKNVIFKPRNE